MRYPDDGGISIESDDSTTAAGLSGAESGARSGDPILPPGYEAASPVRGVDEAGDESGRGIGLLEPLPSGADPGAAQSQIHRRAASGYTSPGRSALVHWRLTSAITVLGLIIGLAVAAVRPPTYTANSYLFVGKTLSELNTSAIPGLAAAAPTIAEDYSRLITQSSVVDGTAKSLGQKGGDLGGSLAASVVAQTPEIIVSAGASNATQAVRLANAGAKALVSAVDRLNLSSQSQLKGLQQTYISLEQQINLGQLRVQQLQSQLSRANSAGASSTEISSLQAQLASAQTQISQDTLNADTAQNQYSSSYSPLISEEQVLQISSQATSASADRKKALELGGIGGLFGGFFVGVLVSSYRDLRGRAMARRRLRNPSPVT